MKKAPVIYDKAMHEARKYWRDRLASTSFDGHIALDHPRPDGAQARHVRLERELDDDVHRLLRRVTGGNQFLVYTTLVLGLQICCWKYSGERRITIFSAATSEGAGGNELPVGAELDAEASFKDALLATKDLLAGAYRNQQYPFERMLLDIPDDRRPQHFFMSASMAGFNAEVPDDRCDVAVRFETAEASTTAAFRFDGRLYDEATLHHFFAFFNGVLRQGLTRMSAPVGDLRADAAEAGVPETAAFDGARLHRLVGDHAARRPEGIAVVQGDRVTTYAALDRDANRLAAALADLRLDARKPVVILMDAGTATIASMLAVLKTGAAFAPVKLLSAGAPVAEILAALDAECIICEPEYVADLQQFRDSVPSVRHVVTVAYSAPVSGNGAPSLEIAHAGDRAGDAGNGESDGRFGTACVLVDVRSGEIATTAVSHAELARLFTWLNARCGIGAGDRCFLSPSLGACEQLYDTFGMLIAGAAVEVAGAASLRDAASLSERLTADGITVWDLPAPLVQNVLPSLLAVAGAQQPRAILLTGEKQSPRLEEELARHFPAARIIGLYASPATGVWSTFFPLDQRAPDASGSAVAEAIPGFAHEVRNQHGEPVPAFTKGELHVRGVDTGLRAAPLEHGRMRWLRGAEHRFVKAGCGVELTGVETILCEHGGVRAAEVFAVKSSRGRADVVVAFVLADPDRVSPESVRDFAVLRDGIDLVPDRFIVVDEFPLAADGAIDRSALLNRLATSHDPSDDVRSAELEKIHQQLKTIWLEILQLDEVGDDDSFFARGGNSLKATLLIARVRDDFGVDLSVQDFFRKPSARAVAQLIEAGSRDAESRHKAPEFKAVSREKYRVQLAEIER